MLPQKNNVVLNKSDAYSDRILKLYQYLTSQKNEFVLSKQILRSGTSIGANVVESRNAQGGKDFVNKLNIALKEADETEFWLKKLYKGDYITEKQYDSMHRDNDEIVRLLTSIIKTMKQRME
ncbi:MAG: four helix bundle protein [Prevotella sp.]|nr:four helix bundle protein [Prevotella sp.]